VRRVPHSALVGRSCLTKRYRDRCARARKRLTDRRRETFHPPVERKERHRDGCADEQLAAARDLLVERDARAAKFLDRRPHLDHVIDPRRPIEFDRHAPDREDEPVAGKDRVVNAEEPEEIRSAALEEAEIAGVIDRPRKIGVLEVDANAERVARSRQGAGQLRIGCAFRMR
jgi:hypothetical protein